MGRVTALGTPQAAAGTVTRAPAGVRPHAAGLRRALGTTAVYLTLSVAAAAMALPFLWMVSTSLKAPGEVVQAPPRWLPARPQWSNYSDALRAAPFARFFLNSMIVATAVTLGQLATAAPAAYVLARRRFPGRDVALVLVLATLMIPSEVTIIPAYLIVRTLGWVDTYFALIVPSLSSGFAIFLLRQFFSTVPREFEDAAAIDGATGLGTLWHIYLPLARPALASLGLLTFLTSWNSYLWPLLVTNRREMRPIQVALRYFMDVDLGNRWPQLMAAAVLVATPVLVVFLVAQRHFIRGLTFSGLKG